MPLTQEEKDYIVNRVVAILKAPDKKTLLAELRDKVLNQNNQSESDEEQLDEAVYAVLEAIEELYG